MDRELEGFAFKYNVIFDRPFTFYLQFTMVNQYRFLIFIILSNLCIFNYIVLLNYFPKIIESYVITKQ